MPDGADVGDERQQPVLLPPGRLHQVAVLVQVVQQQLQREHRLPQCSQLADRAEDRGEVSVEAEQKPDRRMWLLQYWVGSTEASTRHLASRVTGLLAALVTWLLVLT